MHQVRSSLDPRAANLNLSQLRYWSCVTGTYLRDPDSVAEENSPAALLEYLDGLFEEQFGDSYKVHLEPFYSD